MYTEIALYKKETGFVPICRFLFMWSQLEERKAFVLIICLLIIRRALVSIISLQIIKVLFDFSLFIFIFSVNELTLSWEAPLK